MLDRVTNQNKLFNCNIWLCPLFGGWAGSPCKTMWPGLRPTFAPSGILIHLAVWLQCMGRLCPIFWGEAGSQSSTVWPGLRPTSIPSGSLIQSALWPLLTWAESWGLCPLFGERELDLHLTQCRLSRGLPPCQVTSWSIQLFGHNRYGPIIGGLRLCPFAGGGTRSPPNTMWPLPRLTHTPSFILIRPTVWPQYTNVTDRQTGQTDRTGQRSDSTGRTDFTNGHPKTRNPCKSDVAVAFQVHYSAEGKSSPILGRCGLTFVPLQLKTRSTGADEAGTQNIFSNRGRMTL